MKFKLLLFLAFCTTSAFAQIQSQKGQLTLADGVVLNGIITYYYDNPKDVVFYNEKGAKEIFRPNEVKVINLENGEKFVAKGYKVNQDSSTLILQSLIESPKISLLLREDNTIPYFYVIKDGVVYRLENNDVIVNQDRKTYKRKDNKYISILSILMSDRMDLIEKLDKVKLNETDLTKLIVEYNRGDVSYYWKSDNAIAKVSNWVFFTQYSQHGSFLGDETTGYSAGQMVGVQYYFSKGGRHSVKISLDHSNYITEWEKYKVTGVGFRYEFAFKQAEKYGIYMLIQVAEMSSISKVESRGTKDVGIHFIPRLSPGLGFEVKPLNRMALYGEVNNLLQLKYVPNSFSVGLKYDFGKVTR